MTKRLSARLQKLEGLSPGRSWGFSPSWWGKPPEAAAAAYAEAVGLDPIPFVAFASREPQASFWRREARLRQLPAINFEAMSDDQLADFIATETAALGELFGALAGRGSDRRIAELLQ